MMASCLRFSRLWPLLLAFLVWIVSEVPFCLSNIAHHKTNCSEQCGSSIIPYPFYLNAHCGLPGFNLECLKSTLIVKLNHISYNVLSFSSDSIVIDPLNSSCQLSVNSFNFRGNKYYGISLDNFLQLSDCKNSSACLISCNIPIQQNNTECKYNATCCYPLANTTLWHIGDSISSFAKFHCTAFTSWVLSSPSAHTVNAQYGLKMEWAVPSNCSNISCSPNAYCVNATTIKGGVRCKCHDGYAGDGFADGSGCFKGILAAATIAAAILIAFALLRRRKSLSFRNSRGRGDGSQLASLLSFHGKACTTKLFTYKELERATKGFAPSEKLGNGACGTVYAGKLLDGSLVAVKRIHYGSTQGTQQVINEVNVLSTVRHRNLVRLLGCCIEMGSPLLVYEFVPNGTLAEHLQRERGEGLNWLKRIKVADFGLSRLGLTEGSHISTVPQGTPGYLDPEYHQNFHLSDKSDVYSFGVVLIEIITAMKPVDFSRNKKEVNLAALALSKIGSNCLDDIIDPFLQVQKQPLVRALVQRVAELAFRCLAFDKDARPTMIEVADELLLVKRDSMHIRTPSPQENVSNSRLENKKLHKVAMSPSSIQAPWTSNDSSISESLPDTSEKQ